MTHYCVISHTHWDREWYLTQEVFRLKLADLLDNLLDILDAHSKYVFHMDAQTIVLEDYFDIRPENEARCRKYIQEGRLLVGPWYVQNDFLLTSGEATVRNLLLGIKQSKGYGRCMKVGYAPDQFGLISQLPQILHQFDFDVCIFGRGYHNWHIDETGTPKEDIPPAEFRWRAPDGSEVLAICMSYWYNNTQRFSADIDKALALARLQKEQFSGVAQTPYLLCMNGCDHIEPQGDLLEILDAVQKRMDPDEMIYQTTMEEYVSKVKAALDHVHLTEKTGELIEGLDIHVLKDTASSRIYLKTKNAELQNRLERRLEPLYTMLEAAGMRGCYPKGTLDYLWRMLMRNHAHDSICGCSKDAVHNHMVDRFAAIEESAAELEKRGMELLNAHISRSELSGCDYLITVVNTLQKPRTGVLDVRLDVAASDAARGITLYAPDGSVAPYVLLNHKLINRHVTSPINLPSFVPTDQFDLRFLVENVPACGSVTYRVRIDTTSKGQILPEATSMHALENEFLRVEITDDGKINLLHKQSGRWYSDVLSLEDVADTGDSYIFTPLAKDKPIDLHEQKFLAADFLCDTVSQQACLQYEMMLPEGLTSDNSARSTTLVSCPITLNLRLNKKEPFLRVDWDIENHACDHRMRMLVRTGMDIECSTALAPFDLVRHNRSEIDVRLCNESRHNSGLINISDKNAGFAVLNCGVYSYENLQQRPGTLALTVLRSTVSITHNCNDIPEDDAWQVDENQCCRSIHIQTALYPHNGNMQAADVLHSCDCLQTPFLCASAAVDTRKYLGGRPALQEPAIAELFYQPDRYPTVRLPLQNSILSLPDGVEMTALKKAEDNNGYILRMFSTSSCKQELALSFDSSISHIYKTNLAESEMKPLRMSDGVCKLSIAAGEIVTLRLLTE